MSASWPTPEKKTAEGDLRRDCLPVGAAEDAGVAFLAAGGRAQKRYEALRAYMLLPSFRRPRTSPARFDLSRFERFGLLGLLEQDPVGEAWCSSAVEDFRVQVIPVGTVDGRERRARLFAFLSHLITTAQGGEDGSSCPLCPSLHGAAGEGTNDPEPAGRHRAVR